jgi:hypothetical protein
MKMSTQRQDVRRGGLLCVGVIFLRAYTSSNKSRSKHRHTKGRKDPHILLRCGHHRKIQNKRKRICEYIVSFPRSVNWSQQPSFYYLFTKTFSNVNSRRSNIRMLAWKLVLGLLCNPYPIEHKLNSMLLWNTFQVQILQYENMWDLTRLGNRELAPISWKYLLALKMGKGSLL